jgi:WD40 repeat protein
MTRCPSLHELVEFLDESLDSAEAERISEHVSVCEACQAALERMTAEGDSDLASLSATSLPALTAGEGSLAFLEKLKRVPDAEAPGRAAAREAARIPTVEGYQIREVLGRGGMGIVYRAEQLRLSRSVALKMILAGSHASPRDLARFRHEAEAAARLTHVNIVQVYDVGESAGLPYFALEYISGGSLARHLHGDPQPIPATTGMIEQLARAVDFAHRHGIVHRDLKPANVLLKFEEPNPTGNGHSAAHKPGSDTPLDYERATPKIADFGLSKRVGEKDTMTGELLGTPSYMAPEQATSRGQRVGPASDVYALGTILYEMLTGRPPFKGPTPLDTVLQVLHQDPVRPSSLRPGLPRDLETICLKCLEKEPRKRYERAIDLAEDLRRFRQGKPIVARPVNLLERTAKWARRRPAYASLAAGIVLVTALGFAGVTWQWREAASARDVALEEKREKEIQRQAAEQARREAELARRGAADQRERARTQLYFSRIARSQLQWRVNDLTGAQDTLDSCRPGSANVTDRRGWEWRYLNALYRSELFAPMHSEGGEGGEVAYRPDGERIASIVGGAPLSGEATSELRVWGARDGALLRRFTFDGSWRRLAYHPNGKQLALASADGVIRVIDADTAQERYRHRHHSDAVLGIAYSADGTRLVTASWDRTAVICNAENGEVQQTLRGHAGRVQGVAFHPDNRRIATGSWDNTVRLWDLRTGREVQIFQGHKGPVYAVAFSPDGTLLASAGSNGNLKIWDLSVNRAIQSLTGHGGAVLDMAFSPDGRYLACASGDGTVRVWDLESGVERYNFRGHDASAESVRFSPDGQRLVSSSPGRGSVRVWDFTRHPEYATFAHTRADVEALAFHKDGEDILSFTASGRLQRWDAANGVLKEEIDLPEAGTTDQPSGPAVFDSSGTLLAVRGREEPRQVLLWGTDTGERLVALRRHRSPVSALAFNHDGKQLATCGSDARMDDGTFDVRIWSMPDGAEMESFQGEGAVLAVAFSNDGHYLALGKKGGEVVLLDRGTRTIVHHLVAHAGDTAAVAFSPDGKRLASAGAEDRALKIWRLESPDDRRRVLRAAAPPQVGRLAFSPDGKRLAAVSRDLVQIWDPVTAQEVLTLRGAPQRHWDPPFNPNLTFSQDGSRLAASNWNESFSIWDADMPDDPEKQATYQTRRRLAADQRATYWHLQEAQHCIEHRNKVAARYHLKQIEGKELSPTLQTLRQRIISALE